MLSYCLKCRKNTQNINPVNAKTSNGGTIILSKCAVCNTERSRFIKKQEASGILSNLCLKTPLSKIPLIGNILFLNAIPLSAIPLNVILSKKKDGRISCKS